MGTYSVPLELTTDILSRLPVKSIHRFKVVHKSWRDVIESQDFFELHFNRSLQSNSYNCSLFLGVGSDLYRAQVDVNNIKFKVDKLALPPSFRSHVEIIGSCNGLIFIKSGMYHHLAVFNPALDLKRACAFKILPCVNPRGLNIFGYYGDYSYGRQNFVKYGFGFDRISRLYKIVCFSPKRALVYSLKAAESWREVPLPNYPNLQAWHHGVALNNHLHWNCSSSTSRDYYYLNINMDPSAKKLILTFDLETEQWGELPIPDLSVPRQNIIDIGLLDGCLCILTTRNKKHTSRYGHEFWVMKDYGVKGSWTKWFSVPNGSGIPLLYCRERYEFLLPGKSCGLGWYSPRNNRITNVEFHGDRFSGEQCYSLNVKTCIESFVRLFATERRCSTAQDQQLLPEDDQLK